MGIVHFAPVGTSPGAVTSALAYLTHHTELIGQASGAIIQDIVIFCSYQVDDGTRPANSYIWNTYGRLASRQGWKASRGRENTIDVIKKFLDYPANRPILPPNGELYVWPVDVNDYRVCFEAIAKATVAIARSDDTGKYIWANLTGGTNILNSTLMQVASLSGLIGRAYYTFIGHDEDRKYLQPPRESSQDYVFEFIPLIKTTYDLKYYRVLEELYVGPTGWIMGQELLSKLKGTYPAQFDEVEFDHFKNQYLNRMTNDVLLEDQGKSRGGDRPVKISPEGIKLFEYIQFDDLVQELVNRDKANSDLVRAYRNEMSQYKR